MSKKLWGIHYIGKCFIRTVIKPQAPISLMGMEHILFIISRMRCSWNLSNGMETGCPKSAVMAVIAFLGVAANLYKQLVLGSTISRIRNLTISTSFRYNHHHQQIWPFLSYRTSHQFYHYKAWDLSAGSPTKVMVIRRLRTQWSLTPSSWYSSSQGTYQGINASFELFELIEKFVSLCWVQVDDLFIGQLFHQHIPRYIYLPPTMPLTLTFWVSAWSALNQ